jgi:hypothetical protein
MGQEILYTSAPQGLRQGSSGFCTVGSTAGMEPNLAEFLEGFSGYPHPYKPPDPRTKDNPVNYSFIQWTIGGQRYYVLSRVADAGLDHTGRTNLLAHHVALTRREIDRLPGGPAAVMSSDDFFITQWDKQLKTLPGQKPRAAELPLQKCSAWEAAAGDAGYAGVLAEAAKEKGARPVSVIYPAGIDVLELVAEAQSLLPSDRRWNATFATLYSRIYSSFDVQWRFLFHETTEARQARRDPHALVIDLCNPSLPKAAGGDLVTAAREGRMPERASLQPAAAREAVAPGRSRRPAAPLQAVDDGDPRLLPPVVLAEALPDAQAPRLNPFQRSRRQSVWLHYALAGTVGGILALVGALLLVVFAPPREPPIAGLPPAGGTKTRITEATSPHNGSNSTSPAPAPVEPVVSESTSDNPPPETGPPPASPPDPPPSSAISSSPPPPRPMPPSLAPRRDPFEDIDVKKRLKLVLPPRPGMGGLSAGAGGGSPLLAQVYVQSPAEVELKLVGKEAVFGSDAGKVVVEREDKGQASTWRVVKLPAGALGKKEEIGSFKLESQKLTFAWNKLVQAGAKPDSLRHCLLEVGIGGEKRLCRLSAPIPKPGVSLAELQNGAQTVDLPELDATALADGKSLKLEVVPVGLPVPFEKLPKDEPLAIDGEQRILIKGETSEAGPRIELHVRFAADPARSPRRGVLVAGKVTYRTSDLSEEEAMKTLGGPFDMKRITTGLREFNDKVSQFELNIKRQKSRLDEHTKAAEREEKRLELMLKSLRGQLAVADGSLKEEAKRELESAQKQKAAFDKQRAEKGAELHDGLQAETEKQAQAKAKVAQFESVGKLMTDAADKGKLEFRIYFEIDGQTVELYRSTGFPQEL